MALEVEFPTIELLMALKGYEGNVFSFTDGDTSFRVANNGLIKWLIHPSEIEQIKQFMDMASDHLYVCRLVSTSTDVVSSYRHHILKGVQRSLQAYYDELDELQGMLLSSDQKVGAIRFLPILRYRTYFSELKEILAMMETGTKTYNQVISDVYQHANMCAVHEIRQAFNTILSSVQKVLFDDIYSWMLFGYISAINITDFFIQESPKGTFRLVEGNVPVFLLDNGAATKILFVGSLVHYFTSFQKSPKMFDSSIDEFHREMVILKNNDFNIDRLEAFVESVKTVATNYSSEYVLEEEDLVSHLKRMKDVFFTSHEKLWQFFVERLQKAHLDDSWTDDKKNQVLRSLIESILLKFYYSQEESDSFLRHFKFSFKKEKSRIIPTINVEYELPPLSRKIIQPFVMSSCQRLFNFFLELYVSREELCTSFKRQSKLRGKDICRRSCFLRYKLLFLIEHIYNYLKLNVIETRFQDFISDIEKCGDYEEMQMKHSTFIHTISRESFMTYPNIERILLRMFAISHELFGSSKAEADLVEKRDEELKQLFSQLSILLTALKDLKFYSCLSQLLLQFTW